MIVPALLLLSLNLICYFLFAADKRRSKLGQRRIPEKVLHLATLPFATPGAWIAIYTIRHKNRKPSFLLVTFLITILQGILLFRLLASGNIA